MGLALLAWLGLWTCLILFVNPVGEFMVNDDWSFVRCLEAWRQDGRIIATGWGFSRAPGGPFLMVHLWWGHLFTQVWGYSLTALRLSVLLLGLLGSLGLFLLLRGAGATLALAGLGTLTIMVNPLYLSQSFTFMTDITFAALMIFALLTLIQGFSRGSITLAGFGLLLVLGAVCTRQIGLILVPATVTAWWLQRRDQPREVGIVAGLAAGLVLLPWLAGELLLRRAGGTTLIHNQAVQEIVRLPLAKGFFDYGFYLGRCFLFTFLYTGFLVSPVLVGRFGRLWARAGWKRLGVGLTLAGGVGAGAALAGLIRLPVSFPGNVLFNWGIGPVLLKDTYILNLLRAPTLPPVLYLLLGFGAVITAVMLVHLLGSDLRQLVIHRSPPGGFGATLAFLAALAYLIIVVLIGFRDRYLIPLIILITVWLSLRPGPSGPPSRWPGWAAGGLLLFLGVASATALHDFMNLKRALAQAHQEIVQQLGVSPCRVDGGMEFNGYHCYRPEFQPRPGLSWWWVEREDYLVALGPLPGYTVVKTFPFPRWGGGEGAIFLLQPQVAATLGGHSPPSP